MLLPLRLHVQLYLVVRRLQLVNLMLHVLDSEVLQADDLRQLSREVGILIGDADGRFAFALFSTVVFIFDGLFVQRLRQWVALSLSVASLDSQGVSSVAVLLHLGEALTCD